MADHRSTSPAPQRKRFFFLWNDDDILRENIRVPPQLQPGCSDFHTKQINVFLMNPLTQAKCPVTHSAVGVFHAPYAWLCVHSSYVSSLQLKINSEGVGEHCRVLWISWDVKDMQWAHVYVLWSLWYRGRMCWNWRFTQVLTSQSHKKSRKNIETTKTLKFGWLLG